MQRDIRVIPISQTIQNQFEAYRGSGEINFLAEVSSAVCFTTSYLQRTVYTAVLIPEAKMATYTPQLSDVNMVGANALRLQLPIPYPDLIVGIGGNMDSDPKNKLIFKHVDPYGHELTKKTKSETGFNSPLGIWVGSTLCHFYIFKLLEEQEDKLMQVARIEPSTNFDPKQDYPLANAIYQALKNR